MKLARTVLPVLVAVGMLASGGAHADEEPIAVGSDEAGDFGRGTDPDLDPAIAIAGAELGMDLVGAAIRPVNGDDIVEFIITVTSLPPIDGTPEFARYTWDMEVDGELLQLDGKYTNYTRGACDPTAGSCPPARDPGIGPFAVRGNCAPSGGVTVCEEIALVHATFDPASSTITIPVSLELLGGCAVAPAPSLFQVHGESIMVAPSAFFTTNAFPMDLMLVTVTVDVCEGTIVASL